MSRQKKKSSRKDNSVLEEESLWEINENVERVRTYKYLFRETKRLCSKVEACEEANLKNTYREATFDSLAKLEGAFLKLSEEDSGDCVNDFTQLKDECLIMKTNMNVGVTKDMTVRDVQRDTSFLKLPRIGLPEFKGDNTKWLSFRDVFTSAIIKNDSLNDLQRLNYLQSCVSGDAARLIRGFEITEENFLNAWQSLSNRFENERELTYAHLKKIFDIKPIKIANSKNLLELVDVVNESLRNLKTLGFNVDKFTEAIFVFNIQSKLDSETLKQWEFSTESKKIPSLPSFIDFLEKQSHSLMVSVNTNSKVETKFAKSTFVSTAVTSPNNPGLRCILCNNVHPLYKCPQFNAISLKERWIIIKDKRLCSNCLKGKHFSKQCTSQARCKNCRNKHHTLLHSYTTDKIDSIPQSKDNKMNYIRPVQELTETKEMTVPCLSVNATLQCNTLLSTAQIKVKDYKGNFYWCRALVDNASQRTLISKNLQQILNLRVKTSIHTIKGINNAIAETSLATVKLEFTPHFSNEIFDVQALVVNNITSNLPNFQVKLENWPHLSNLKLADPYFHISAPVDILLGADLYMEIMKGNPILGPKGSPSALETKLGFLLSGSLFSNHHVQDSLSCHLNMDFGQQLSTYWDIENLPEISTSSSDDHLCEEFYKKTVTRDKSGRYCVKLPIKENVILGDTYYQTLHRFHSLENRLGKNAKLKEMYVDFMKEYLELEHMEIVPKDSKSTRVCYLPHHGVLKENNVTTKLRVVFNGSMNSQSGLSLNDALLTGPKLQSNLFSILIQFRSFQVALNADIMKMYRQIKVSKEDADLQRILWRENPSVPLQEYRLVTLAYGTSCAPYLALRTLQQLAMDERVDFPEASKVTLSSFYVDDLLSGADTIAEANMLVEQLNHLMSKGGFTLRKWTSNKPEALVNVESHLKSNSPSVDIMEDQSQKILGLQWKPMSDTLQINIASLTKVFSKRSLLSVISRIFDPLGILSPCTITLKIMMQDIWKDKLSWDEALPIHVLQQWEKFQKTITFLKEISIPRYLNFSRTANYQIHGFADASRRAYAAVLYLRTCDSDTKASVSIIAAKTKVSPTKPITLPKLELCAALLLAKLLTSITSSFPCSETDIYLWSDSQIVLCWLAAKSSKLTSFVSHRVSQIKSLTSNATWSHISGHDNPADCASRGVLPHQLYQHRLWWDGPEWLHSNPWVSPTLEPNLDVVDSNIMTVDRNEIQCHHETQEVTPDFILKISSYSKLIRVTAWLLRFIKNCRFPLQKTIGILTAQEIQCATFCIVRIIQEISFTKELAALRSNRPLSKSSKLLPLSIFLDKEGIIRVGGRLSAAKNLEFDHRHPMLLPSKHHATSILIQHLHIKHLHAGTQLVLSFLRQQFWIINGRSVIRKILHSCIICFKFKSQPCTQIMGNLPEERITHVRPFYNVGVDFSGAFLTKSRLTRSKVRFKSYVCLFICMSTKAVHLELVSELSTNCFIACLRRFVSRRGLPSGFFSDNATNFRGAAKYLNQFHQICKGSEVQSFCSNQLIRWHFIPAYSPNFGGLWEASIKLTKSHLLRVCKASLLNFEQLTTVLCQIEAIINSRPIVPLSNDTNDLLALTPGHFLIGAPLVELPNETRSSGATNLTSRWKLLQDLRLNFWTRWSVEYLHHLQTRTKWNLAKPNLQVGQLVVIREPNLPPFQWMLGRVTQTFPGSDGQTRVISLRTAKGEITRSISKLTPLPIDSN